MTKTGSDILTLPEVLDMDAAVELAELLRHRRDAPVSLDASAVAHFGAACLQVLLAAKSSWHREGKAFGVVTPSEAFLCGLKRFGIGPAELMKSGTRA